MRRALKTRSDVQREGKNGEMPCSVAVWMPQATSRTIIESFNKLRALFTEQRRDVLRLNGVIFETAL
jgi:hypothetical protein